MLLDWVLNVSRLVVQGLVLLGFVILMLSLLLLMVLVVVIDLYYVIDRLFISIVLV